MGGAAGQYAHHSITGGTNAAGLFIARATLAANFSENGITGTINQFMGADGKSRDWSVDLMKSSISAVGTIAGDPDDTTNTGIRMTQWTIGGIAADADGDWSGSLQENDGDRDRDVLLGVRRHRKDGRCVRREQAVRSGSMSKPDA